MAMPFLNLRHGVCYRPTCVIKAREDLPLNTLSLYLFLFLSFFFLSFFWIVFSNFIFLTTTFSYVFIFLPSTYLSCFRPKYISPSILRQLLSLITIHWLGVGQFLWVETGNSLNPPQIIQIRLSRSRVTRDFVVRHGELCNRRNGQKLQVCKLAL